MTDLTIAQALFDGVDFFARSANFRDEWQTLGTEMCQAFGAPEAGTHCPDAFFAHTFGKKHVAIVQVRGTPHLSGIRFYFLILNRELYGLLNDPFAIADRFPPNWEARGSLPDLAWPPEPLPPRTVAQLDAVLKQGDGPFLLGAAQALIDSGKIMLEKSEPETKRLRDLWALLPDSTRRDVWPATFAFSTALGFNIVALPKVPEGGIPGYLNEEQTRDYPESRFEKNLQIAIECGDQRMLDALLHRRSSADTMRLAMLIILLSVGAVIVGRLLVTLGVL